jgi:hypothetical protein
VQEAPLVGGKDGRLGQQGPQGDRGTDWARRFGERRPGGDRGDDGLPGQVGQGQVALVPMARRTAGPVSAA